MTGQAGHSLLLVHPPPPPGAIIAREASCRCERQCPESANINIIPSGLCNSRRHRQCPASKESVIHTPVPRQNVLQGVRLHNPDYVKFAPSASCEGCTPDLPGEAAAGEEFAQGGDYPSPPSLTPHFALSLSNVSVSPAPLPQSSPPQAPEATASAPFFERKGSRYSWAQSAAPRTVSAMRRSSLAFSVRASRASCRLTQLRCWVVPGRDSSSSASSVRRVPSLHSTVSLRLDYTRPLFLQALCPCCFARGPRFAAVRARQQSHKAFRAAGKQPFRLLAQTVSGFRSAPPATDCADTPASTLLRPAPIRRPVPVREHRCTPLKPRTALTGWAVPAQVGEAVCPPHKSVSSAAPGSPRSPFHRAPEPTTQSARPPPRPPLRFAPCPWSLGDSKPCSRIKGSNNFHVHPARPSRLRDSQQPRLTRLLTPRPQCVIDRSAPPGGRHKGYKYTQRKQRLPPLRVVLIPMASEVVKS